MKRRVLFILIFFTLKISLLFSSPPSWEPIQGTLYSMVVFAEISLFNQPFEGISTNMAGAFGPSGEQDCRALAVWQPANPPYWEGYWYFTIVGNENGQMISFKIYNELTDFVYTCAETITFEDNTTIGDPFSPYGLTAISVGVNPPNFNCLLISAYPNPFYDFITFDFSALHDKVKRLIIYDIEGRLIRKFTNNEFHNSNTLNWTGTDLKGTSVSTGIYFYKVETDNLNSIGKILYIQ